MSKIETEPAGGENVKHSESAPDNAIKSRKSALIAKRLETVVAILLGITTLLSAWASWIGHLHGGLQSINFTKSNNMASKGSAEYNMDVQAYLSDYMVWNTLRDYNKESQNLLEEGMRDNTKGDSYMLVTVIYSLTLFLLGIVGTFKNMPNRITVMAIAFVCLVFAFIYMCTIPFPTGFEKMNFFDFKK